jgi:thymidine kinase
MFASKTTRLLGALEREHYRSTRDDDIILIKHSLDTRHESHLVKTHHGLVRHATLSASTLRDVELPPYARVVCIDEG